MAKKKVQIEQEVEIVAPDVEKKGLDKKSTAKESKKDIKVENSKQKTKSKNSRDKKSMKKKAAEVWSELKKVSKPSFGTVCKNTCVVISVVAICTLLLFGVDRLFSLFNDLLLP